ncbi:unnamed protein product [Lepidochelys kempii]
MRTVGMAKESCFVGIAVAAVTAALLYVVYRCMRERLDPPALPFAPVLEVSVHNVGTIQEDVGIFSAGSLHPIPASSGTALVLMCSKIISTNPLLDRVLGLFLMLASRNINFSGATHIS